MASLSILLLTVMSGCSDSDIREKFIGDWKGKNLNDEPVMIKIKKQDDKYVVFGGDNQLPVDYNKDENSFIGKEDSHTLEIKYQKSDDKLIFSFDGKIVECERIK